MRSTFVGIRTGPLTFRLFSLAPLIRSATFSRDLTTRLVRVMRIRWMGASSAGAFMESPLKPASLANDMVFVLFSGRLNQEKDKILRSAVSQRLLRSTTRGEKPHVLCV